MIYKGGQYRPFDDGQVKKKNGDQQGVSVGFRPLGSIGHATNNTWGV